MTEQTLEEAIAEALEGWDPDEEPGYPPEWAEEDRKRHEALAALERKHPAVRRYSDLVQTLFLETTGEPSAWDRMREAWPLRDFAIYQHNHVLLPLLQAVQDMINVGISEMDIYRANPCWHETRRMLASSYSATIRQLAKEEDPLLLSRGEPKLDHLLPDFEAELDQNHWAWGLIREFRRARSAKTPVELTGGRTLRVYVDDYLFKTVVPSTLMRAPLHFTSHSVIPGPEYPGWVAHLFRSIFAKSRSFLPEKRAAVQLRRTTA
jgi:hypothetical protein